MSAVVNGSLLTTDGVIDDGYLIVESGRIVALGTGRPEATDLAPLDAGGGWVAPGFIDLQINGGHGIDLTTEPERIGELGRWLPRYGVTAFVPTIITSPLEMRAAALGAWSTRTAAPDGGAIPLGLHLEGPMLAESRRGAHPAALLVPPSDDVVAGWSADAGVALATLAPELPGALHVITELVARGVVVSLGHTDATAAQFAAGLAAGATAVTHLFNGMRPFTHRDPGPIGAVLADDRVVAGLICDGIHVDPVAVRMAWRALGAGRLNLVTDAVAALGASARVAGTIGTVDVTVASGRVRTADGVLAGSDLSLDRAVRNLIAFTGCSVREAVATVTSTPADVLRLADRGRLTLGSRADITVLDHGLRVVATVVSGELVWPIRRHDELVT